MRAIIARDLKGGTFAMRLFRERESYAELEQFCMALRPLSH